MEKEKIIISGVGCALADFLYTNIDFNSPECKKYLSHTEGDGGISFGKLIFTEELEKFAGKPFHAILADIAGSHTPNAFNLGGPSLVSLIHASQILHKNDYEVKFYGIAGKDEKSTRIFRALKNLPLNISNYVTNSKYTTPFTYVLSDPNYNKGEGERTFINNIGAAGYFTKEMLGENFFDSRIVCLGGTALVPQIHDSLTQILKKARDNNCITVVNTVYDFRSEKNHPGQPWVLGDGRQDFKWIDVLIMDLEESLKISGQKSLDEAIAYYTSSQVSSFVITNGASEVIAYSNGGLFEKTEGVIQLPVSQKVKDELDTILPQKRDTTGCGDNFSGGVIASIAMQMKMKPKRDLDLKESVAWGIVSGGFACYYAGGTYFEKYPGEKLEKIQQLYEAYLIQTGW